MNTSLEAPISNPSDSRYRIINEYPWERNLQMSKLFLKVKRDSLAEEARIIRRQELNLRKWKLKAKVARDAARVRKPNRKYDPVLREALRDHRMKIVRPEVRAANLAMGFLNFVPYRDMERIAFTSPNWRKVYNNIVKFGPNPDSQELRAKFEAWVDTHAMGIAKTHNQNPLKDYAGYLSPTKHYTWGLPYYDFDKKK